jgi:hypothetical protein
MYNTFTKTYTVTDIRKAFENFQADFRAIARRTEKMDMTTVDNIIHDILILAENKFLRSIDIVLLDNNETVIRATKFEINQDGTATSSDRAGKNNDWLNIPNTYLSVILSYNENWNNLSEQEKEEFQNDNNFKTSWVTSNIDNTFPHLSKNNAQLYASNGYELNKTVYK